MSNLNSIQKTAICVVILLMLFATTATMGFGCFATAFAILTALCIAFGEEIFKD